VLECVADFLANGRAAGFAQGPDGVAERAQTFRKNRNLRGLAAALGAFKCDEQPFQVCDA
jgi:hypothetical protein